MKNVDVPAMLAKLAEIRKAIPKPSKPRPKRDESSRTASAVGSTEEDFETAALIDALEDMSDELSAALEEKRAKLIENALEVYWTAYELSQDPAHADLVPHVENMRAAYERDFGTPPPPRKPKKNDPESE